MAANMPCRKLTNSATTRRCTPTPYSFGRKLPTLPGAGELGRCAADAVVREQTIRCEYSRRGIREMELYSRPATRVYAAGAPQPIVAADARQLGHFAVFL
jgi:hypothetical protein